MNTDECYRNGWVDRFEIEAMEESGNLGHGVYRADYDDGDWRLAFWDQDIGEWSWFGTECDRRPSRIHPVRVPVSFADAERGEEAT